MTKRAFALGAVAALLLPALAVARTANAQDGCSSFKEVKDVSSFTIRVNDEAVPEFDCVKIKLKATTIVWEGTANADSVIVVFKDPSLCNGAGPNDLRPEKPLPKANRSTLDKKQHKTKGEFCYSVIVIRKDGTVRSVDPRLIINP